MLTESERTAEAVTVAVGRRFVVVDNVLSPVAVAALMKDERAVKHRPSLSSVDPIFDGMAFYADSSFTSMSAGEDCADEVKVAVRKGLETLGAPPMAVEHFRFWRYRRGVGLDWHDDGRGRGAAFTLYLSGEWRATWGGELELFDCPVDEVPCVEFDVPKDLMNAPVLATSIAPRPNRLVVMLAGTFHRVRKVEASAGDSLRRSITGFMTAE